ncbi:glucokinase glkA [Histoplasma ohiense]|nr:glucokinase glkA [Histoplasma ohiense (nom. inval.)]
MGGSSFRSWRCRSKSSSGHTYQTTSRRTSSGGRPAKSLTRMSTNKFSTWASPSASPSTNRESTRAN